jgi:hypothetical protein
MSLESGKIEEFSIAPIQIEIINKSDPTATFVLTVKPTDVANLFTIASNKLTKRYNASMEQAKQHIKDALEIARISMYANAHHVIFHVPYYPNLSISPDKMESVLPLINRILDNYM